LEKKERERSERPFGRLLSLASKSWFLSSPLPLLSLWMRRIRLPLPQPRNETRRTA